MNEKQGQIQDDTVKLLKECDSGIRMGISSINDVLDYVKNDDLRNKLAQCREGHEKLRLIAEYANILRCELNGVRIDDRWSKCRLWGPKDADIDVADIVKTGHNRLCVVFETPDFPTRYFVPFVMLRGDFETDRANILPKRGEYVAAPINEQGHPAFCGSGSYVFRTVLSAEEAAETAAISVDSNDAAELIVNGKSAGVRLWKPFRYNVEGLLAEGENTLEFKMTLPMHNLFMETSYCAPDGEALSVGLTGAPRLEIKA